MKNTKKTSRFSQKKRGVNVLTKRDLTIIRKYLAKNWRAQIHESHISISLRQITEVFNQRTNNPDDNKAVWTAINKVLQNAGEQKLAEKVNKRISLCLSLYNVTQ